MHKKQEKSFSAFYRHSKLRLETISASDKNTPCWLSEKSEKAKTKIFQLHDDFPQRAYGYPEINGKRTF